MTFVTPEEYLVFERASEEKHEYYAGEILGVRRSNENHNLIAGSTLAALHPQLRKRPCEMYVSQMRLKIRSSGLYTYPDITVVCGTPEFEDGEVDTLLNPTVIIEVLSPSTEAYDRGKKFQHYRTIPSLQEYLLIAQDSVRIEHYGLVDKQWVLTDAHTPDMVVQLPAIDCTLRLSDVYEKVTFDDPEGLHS